MNEDVLADKGLLCIQAAMLVVKIKEGTYRLYVDL
jgi:hypothetical protein